MSLVLRKISLKLSIFTTSISKKVYLRRYSVRFSVAWICQYVFNEILLDSLSCGHWFQYRYRNKQLKHLLRFSLICGLYNYELGF